MHLFKGKVSPRQLVILTMEEGIKQKWLSSKTWTGNYLVDIIGAIRASNISSGLKINCNCKNDFEHTKKKFTVFKIIFTTDWTEKCIIKTIKLKIKVWFQTGVSSRKRSQKADSDAFSLVRRYQAFDDVWMKYMIVRTSRTKNFNPKRKYVSNFYGGIFVAYKIFLD